MLKNWFRRKDHPSIDVEKRIQEIERSLQKIAEEGFKNQIHIETLHIHNPALDKLEFRFDALDIEEVSGALNLGNNFGVRVIPRQVKRAVKSELEQNTASAEDSSTSEEVKSAGTSMKQTTEGFSFRFSSK